MDTNYTTKFDAVTSEGSSKEREIIEYVYEALKEKGYHPINQLVGYLLSGDPTYVTTFKDARKMIQKIERDEILEALLEAYLVK